jgi:hypothetical protein
MAPKRTSPDNIICIDLTKDVKDSDEDKNDLQRMKKKLRISPDAVKSEAWPFPATSLVGFAGSNDDNCSDNDEVEVVEDISTYQPAATAAAAASKNDDVEVVGTKNQVRLPHMRQHCTEKPFDFPGFSTAARNATRMQFCENCYCYVCDIKAGECKSWSTHSGASDHGHM